MTNVTTKIKLAVVGLNGVGKSAVTVRYLTKRFISEYSSQNDFLFKHNVVFEDNVSAEVEILDTTTIKSDYSHGYNYDQIRWADAFLIVYSIVDRESFNFAENLLAKLAKLKSFYTCLLIGNKSDLEHSRVVARSEVQDLCIKYNCQALETSAAESYTGIRSAFKVLLKEARSANLQRCLPIRRKLGVNTVGVNFSKALGNIFGKNSKGDRKRPSLSI